MYISTDLVCTVPKDPNIVKQNLYIFNKWWIYLKYNKKQKMQVKDTKHLSVNFGGFLF